MDPPAIAVFRAADLLRVGAWVGANGLAALLAAPLLSRSPLLIALPLFGLVLGVLQSAAVSRTLREALAWTALTAIGLGVAVVLVIPLLGVVYGTTGEAWIAAGTVSLLLGAGMSGAQSLVLALRDVSARVLGVWVIVSAFAAALVGALAFIGLPNAPLLSVIARVLSSEVQNGVVPATLGILFAMLTVMPLTAVLAESRAAGR